MEFECRRKKYAGMSIILQIWLEVGRQIFLIQELVKRMTPRKTNNWQRQVKKMNL